MLLNSCYWSVSCDQVAIKLLIDQSINLLSYLFHHSLRLPLMRGKRARTASSSPQYERVIWIEKKTARGSRLTATTANSPKTPKLKKSATPHSKKRRLEPFSTATADLSSGNYSPNPLTPIKLKKKSGQVSFTV